MTLPSLNCAQAIRDDGILALAALNATPAGACRGVDESCHRQIKLAIGRAMSAFPDETVNRAVHFYPALNPAEKTWSAVAKAWASALAAS